ncbi:MAG: hypothetical protein NVS3B20_00700 [Polyangiales bacterium]
MIMHRDVGGNANFGAFRTLRTQIGPTACRLTHGNHFPTGADLLSGEGGRCTQDVAERYERSLRIEAGAKGIAGEGFTNIPFP